MQPIFFIFDFAIISAITPPVALASYAAAGISGADPLKTAITSCRLGLAAFIVPYMFVYAPQLLLVGSTTKIIFATVTSMIGVVALAGSVMGWFIKKILFFEKILLMAAALTLIKPGLYTDIAGARTGLVGGCVPAGGALISLEKMNQATHLYYAEQADEWRVSAQAGLLLSDLDTMVSEKQFPGMSGNPGSSLIDNLTRFSKDPAAYFYPPDPTEMSATIGGTVATNASGARTYRYGTTRDWVRGIRVITVDGEILDIPRGKYF